MDVDPASLVEDDRGAELVVAGRRGRRAPEPARARTRCRRPRRRCSTSKLGSSMAGRGRRRRRDRRRRSFRDGRTASKTRRARDRQSCLLRSGPAGAASSAVGSPTRAARRSGTHRHPVVAQDGDAARVGRPQEARQLRSGVLSSHVTTSELITLFTGALREAVAIAWSRFSRVTRRQTLVLLDEIPLWRCRWHSTTLRDRLPGATKRAGRDMISAAVGGAAQPGKGVEDELRASASVPRARRGAWGCRASERGRDAAASSSGTRARRTQKTSVHLDEADERLGIRQVDDLWRGGDTVDVRGQATGARSTRVRRPSGSRARTRARRGAPLPRPAAHAGTVRPCPGRPVAQAPGERLGVPESHAG